MDNYRSVLEVLKLANAYDVLKECSVVSTTWRRAENSAELWWELCAQEDISDATVDTCASAKEAFQYQFISSFLVGYHQSQLYLFHCGLGKSIRRYLLPSRDFPQETTLCTFLPDRTLLFVGGGVEVSARVRRFCLRGEISTLPNMKVARKLFGLIYFSGAVYVFGGETKKEILCSCEKLMLKPPASLRTWKWLSLPAMHACRSAFRPCIYGHLIYLCGGKTEVSETYEPATSTFQLLPFSLPEAASATAVIHSNRLLIFQNRYTHSWNLQWQAHLETKAVNEPWDDGYMNPVVIGSSIYFTVTKTGSDYFIKINADTFRRIMLNCFSRTNPYFYDEKTHEFLQKNDIELYTDRK